MKLNIGASDPRGRYRQPEWVNIDYSRFFRAGRFHRFAIADGTLLPFRDDAFVEIHAVHVLEHVPRETTRRNGDKVNAHLAFAQEICRVLTPDGVGYIEVPNFVEVCQIIVNAARELEDLEERHVDVRRWDQLVELARVHTVGVYGKGRHEGDFHRWGFSPWGMESLLGAAGLSYARESEMISAHCRHEPVLLYRVWKGGRDPRSC